MPVFVLTEDSLYRMDESASTNPADQSNGGMIPPAEPPPASVPWYRQGITKGAVVGTVVGAGAAVIAAPLVVSALGFGSAGIGASSYAAGMMSSAAVAKGGGVAAGSLVATLQSVGAAGFGGAAMTWIGATGAAGGAAIGTGTVAGVRKIASFLPSRGNSGGGGGVSKL